MSKNKMYKITSSNHMSYPTLHGEGGLSIQLQDCELWSLTLKYTFIPVTSTLLNSTSVWPHTRRLDSRQKCSIIHIIILTKLPLPFLNQCLCVSPSRVTLVLLRVDIRRFSLDLVLTRSVGKLPWLGGL